MIDLNGHLVKHSISERLFPHNVVSSEFNPGGIIQLSNGGGADGTKFYKLRTVSRSGVIQTKDLPSPLNGRDGNTVWSYYPKNKIMINTNGTTIQAISAKSGTLLWAYSVAGITSIISISINRNTKKIHVRCNTSSSPKTFTLNLLTGDGITELTGINANRWGTYNYKENVFYNMGTNNETLTKVNGSTGAVIASFANSTSSRFNLGTQIEVDLNGHVLTFSRFQTTGYLNLFDSNLNRLCYSTVVVSTYPSSACLDNDGSGDYYVPTFGSSSLSPINIYKFRKITGNTLNPHLIQKTLINHVTNAQISNTYTAASTFSLKNGVFISFDSFQASSTYRTYWFIINKADLEISFDPLQRVASNDYSGSIHIPSFGKLGE